MRDIERRAGEMGLSWQTLMENAGLTIAREVKRLRGSVLGSRILILVGPGNNGGDGLVAARHLHDWGAEVSLYLSHARKPDDDNYRRDLERGILALVAEQDKGTSSLDGLLSSADVVIDSLLGTGRSRAIGGALKDVLDSVVRAKEGRPSLMLMAVDLPSGLDADSGAVDPATPRADATITLGYPKLGIFSFPGAAKTGRLIVADIGIPPELANDVSVELVTSDIARRALPARPLDANKGAFGKVMVVAGSNSYIGAAYLACAAALRSGVGLATLAVARSLPPVLAAKLTEATYLPLPESTPGVPGVEAAATLTQSLAGYQAMLVGCGLGQHPATAKFLEAVFEFVPVPPLVLDADGLNIASHWPGWWDRLPSGTILTPHPGEMSRLTGVSVAEIQVSRMECARDAAGKWGKTVVLKGAHTIVAGPDGQVRISPFANAGLASAGTGDVLSGVIAGLLAQGLSPLDAATCGVYLHGQAGEVVRAELGDAGMMAGDLLAALPGVRKGLQAGGR
ncbi:MAG: NAD(P)H-hydrate dehydratase [Chloroflexi bacterium]|nr:NAD(P)H-hydrate dehydratase [Chloroflexota bacterium]